jgi:hypothetical protein
VRGGVECGRLRASAGSARTEEEIVGRRALGAAISGRDDGGVADEDVPAKRGRLSNRLKVRVKEAVPSLNQFSIFETLDGRLRGV